MVLRLPVLHELLPFCTSKASQQFIALTSGNARWKGQAICPGLDTELGWVEGSVKRIKTLALHSLKLLDIL